MAFRFFSKRKPLEKSVSSELPEITAEEREGLHEKLEVLKQTLKDGEDLADKYEQIGLTYSKLGDDDKAIENLEKSLEVLPSIGDGYKVLMSLYNKKRADSARSGDDNGIDYYMNKMDDMRQIAKITTLKR
jgi:tetratricopeptide (TPR) repeat protein